jgi:hypothetical protein
MKVHFYLEGGIIPANYDYDLDLDGILAPSNRPLVRNRGTILVVLQNNGKSPTRGQLKTIATIRTINPNWELSFYFQNTKI